MMRAGRDYLTRDGGFVIPAQATVVVDGKRLTMCEFLKSGFAGGTVRRVSGEAIIETFKTEG